MVKDASAAGVPPRTPLGSLQRSPDLLAGLRGGEGKGGRKRGETENGRGNEGLERGRGGIKEGKAGGWTRGGRGSEGCGVIASTARSPMDQNDYIMRPCSHRQLNKRIHNDGQNLHASAIFGDFTVQLLFFPIRCLRDATYRCENIKISN